MLIVPKSLVVTVTFCASVAAPPVYLRTPGAPDPAPASVTVPFSPKGCAVPDAASVATLRVPLLTVTPPPKVFALERVVVPVPACVSPPVPLMAVAVKSVPWTTEFERLMVKVPLSTMVLAVESVPVVPPLPNCSVPWLIKVVLR